ncbi:hATC [Nesidiocoris tenuis]|nr:hATC [Nesidiocoris tenuis]
MSKRFCSDSSTSQSPPLPKLVCMVNVSDLSGPSLQSEQQPLSLSAQNQSSTVFLSPASLQGDTDLQELGCPVDPPESLTTPNHESQTPSGVLLRDILTSFYNTPRTLPADKTAPANNRAVVESSALENSVIPSQRRRREPTIPQTPPLTPASTTLLTPNTAPYSLNSHPPRTRAPQQPAQQKQKKTCCLIDVLLRSPFTSLSSKQRKYVILIGKPGLKNLSGLPLNNLSSNDWITECLGMKRYFCWPCLLFQPRNSEITYHSVQQHATLPTHHKHLAILGELLRSQIIPSPCSSTSQSTKTSAPPANSESSSSKNTPDETCILSLIESNRSCGNWWTSQRQLEIIKLGRPCPILRRSANPETDVTYCAEMYNNFTWMAGSGKQNKFFCWPCLIFSPKYPAMVPGASVYSAAKQHRLSKCHLWSSFRLKEMEKKIDRPSPPHVLDVDRQSEYLKRLIDVDCFVKTCSSDSQSDSTTISGLIDQLISSDEALQRQIRSNPNSYSVKMADVSTCIQHTVNERIREEINDSPYVALILEDVSNVVDKSFIATFICYVSKNGDICERFLSFHCIAFDRSAKTILNLVTKVLVKYEVAQKLVGITYGGTVLDPFQTKSFHAELEQICPHVGFFNYGGHDLKKTILQSLSHLPKLRYFIQSLDYDSMTHHDPRIFDLYDREMLQKIMKDQGSQWFFMCIASNFKTLARRYDDLGSPNVAGDSREAKLFKSVETQFLIGLLAKIFTKVNDLLRALYSGHQMRSAISQFVLGLLTVEAEGYSPILDDAKKSIPGKTDRDDKPLDLVWYRDTFDITLKYVSEVVMFRTEENDLTALRRCVSSAVTSKDDIGRLLRRCNFQFHIEKLMNQLDFSNKTNFFTNKTPIGLIRSIVNFRMTDSLSELHRFLRLVIVTSAADYDEGSSSVKNMRILMKKNRSLFSNLSDAQIRIESSLLREIQKESSFYMNCFDCFKKL